MISFAIEAFIVASHSLVASIVAKATVVTVLGFFAVWLARRSRAAVRHALLTAMFSVTLVLPIVSIVAPPVHVVVPIPMESRPAIPSSRTTRTDELRRCPPRNCVASRGREMEQR